MDTQTVTERENGTRRVQSVNNSPSKTEQHHTKKCSMKNIMEGYKRNGLITHTAKNVNVITPGQNFLNASDYHEKMNQVANVNTYFESLPASIRSKFGNRAEKLLEFLDNPENKEKAEKMGLLGKPPVAEFTQEEKAVKAQKDQAEIALKEQISAQIKAEIKAEAGTPAEPDQ